MFSLSTRARAACAPFAWLGIVGFMRVVGVTTLAMVLGGLIGCGSGPESRPDAAAPVSGDAATDAEGRLQARVRMATTLLDEGQIEAGLDQLRRLPAGPESQVSATHTPTWFEPVIERLLRRRELGAADSLLALSGPLGGRSPRVQALTASLQVMKGEFENAVGTYAAIRTDDPALQVRVLHELASLELTRGEARAALERAHEGMVLAPAHQPLRLIAAQALRQLDRPTEALSELRAMNEAPARWVAEAELFLDFFDRPDTAVALLQRALRIVPHDLHFRHTLGRALLEAGDARRAVQTLHPLAARPAPFGQSQSLLVRAYRESGQASSADSLEALIGAKEQQERVQELRLEGLRLSYGDENEAALATFDAALALAPTHGDLHNDRGTTLARLQRWDEAERAFRRAAGLRPADPTPVENLARLYDRTGDVDARDQALVEAQARRAAPADAPGSQR